MRTTASTPRRSWARRWISCSAVALALLAAGCGSDDEERPAAQTEQRTQAQQGPSDQTQVNEIASRYLEAFAAGEWRKVCATLSPRARARLARKGGSCVKVYSRNDPEDAEFLLPSRVRVRGDRAVVDVSFNGDASEGVEFKLYAAKIDGRWWLYIRRAAKGAP